MARVNKHEVNRLRAEMHRDNEVQLFAVSPASQGKGYGKALMEAYIRECKRLNVKRVTWTRIRKATMYSMSISATTDCRVLFADPGVIQWYRWIQLCV